MTRQSFDRRVASRGRPYSWIAGAALLGACVALCGCTGDYYRRTADRDAYAIVAQKTPKVPGMESGFRLTPVLSQALLKSPVEGKLVSLQAALALAKAYNRDYETQRESLYLQALDLAYQRYLWTPILSGVLSGAWSQTDPSDDRSVTGSSNFSISQLLWTGGNATLSLATNFFRSLSGDPRQTASSLLSFAATQHLWQGAGVSIAMENLRQAERSMVYALRSFVRFDRNFEVSMASSYYRILQGRNVVENTRRNMESLTTVRERAEMLAEAGQMSDFEVASARQEELTAKDSFISATETYQSDLDAFKIQLGLPTQSSLELDPAELPTVTTQELPKLSHTQRDVTDIALRCRLDLASASDAVDDAGRKVKVARDALNPSVDLVLNAAIGTQAPDKAFSFTEENSSYGYGVNVGLPLNQMPQRNAYRGSLISLDQARRARDQTIDEVRLSIANDWRSLEHFRESYDIQRMSVDLAMRRVDSTTMLVEAQRATMRELLDAQSSLLASQNQLTSDLVTYKVSLLQLWRDMEVLEVKNGQFVEEIPRDDERKN